MYVFHPQSAMPANRRIPVSLQYETIESDKKQQAHDIEPIKPLQPQGDDEIPAPGSKILLHSCCAPCSGAMIEEMKLKYSLDVTIFFYNPNIHPRKEYEIRKNENKRFAEKLGIDFIDCDYDSSSWYERMSGMEYEPERGKRCLACFDIRLEVTAAYGIENGFEYFTTTNASSRWKDIEQINLSGFKASSLYSQQQQQIDHQGEQKRQIKFWKYNWQSNEMTSRKYQISVNEKFYKQEYCGCSYSLRDSNLWRAKQGIPLVKIGGEIAGIGNRYFTDVKVDEEDESQEIVDAFFRDAQNDFGDQTRMEKRSSASSSSVVVPAEKNGIVYDGRMKSSQDVNLNNW